MLCITESVTPIEAIVINTRTDVGIADVWLNKDIQSYIKADPETDEEVTHYSAKQAYFQHTASDTLLVDLEADFDGWFEYASKWEAETPQLNAQQGVTDRLDMIEECLLEMSMEVYK